MEYENNWSARWERTYSFNPGTYKFTLCGDDGIHLYLNNTLVIDEWHFQAFTCYEYQQTFNSASSIPLKIEYFQLDGGAGISSTVVGVGGNPVYGSTPASGSTLNFGGTTVGSTLNYNISISELGNATLNVSNPTITGTNASDFVVTTPAFPLYIADGAASKQVNIRCIPGALGSRSATLSFTTNDPSKSSVSYNLSCTGNSGIPVNTGLDTGGSGTLSYALTNASSGQTITFTPGVTNITFTSGHPPLPALKPGVTLQGQCGPNGPQITIDGTGMYGDGLYLQGNNQIYGI